MPRFANTSTPTYRKHKPSGQAVVTLDGRDFYLGPHGTATSRGEYDRIVGEWMASGRRLDSGTQSDLTVVEVIAKYLDYARTRYRKGDALTKEYYGIRLAMRPLQKPYGRTRAGEFGPRALKTVRRAMIDNDQCMSTVNTAIGRIKRMFKWAASNEMVSAGVFHALQTVDGLRRGTGEARDPRIVTPAPDAQIDAVSHIMRTLEQLAKVLMIPILVFCQANRQGLMTYEPLELWHIRDSGYIEQLSSVVMSIERPMQLAGVQPSPFANLGPRNTLPIRVLKNRWGPTHRSVDDGIDPGKNRTKKIQEKKGTHSITIVLSWIGRPPST